MKKIFASSVIIIILILYGLLFVFTSEIIQNTKANGKEKKALVSEKEIVLKKEREDAVKGRELLLENPLPVNRENEILDLWSDSPLLLSEPEVFLFLFLTILYSIRVYIKQKKKKESEVDDFELYE